VKQANQPADPLLRVTHLAVNRSGRNIVDDISFQLDTGDSLAIVGPAGSGKTTLGLALANKLFYRGEVAYYGEAGENICWVEQQHHFTNLQHTGDLYYQQRYNSYDTEETETVEESLGELAGAATDLFREMEIEELQSRRLIQLSNGENKKLQLLRARLGRPTTIILDQPFVGLDKATRQWLHNQLGYLAASGILVILITSADELPPCINKVIELDTGKMKAFVPRSEFVPNPKSSPARQAELPGRDHAKVTAISPGDDSTGKVIEFRNVTVQYGEKIVLENVSWSVDGGERWLLAGPNGAGKSTLLSLITADNPKAYANDIILFGRKRGSGESIWDIKKKIGFISPELHLYFDQGATCFETVASGLFDTIGLFRMIDEEERYLVERWMEWCGIASIGNKRLYELSTGEQRTVLLARALVKDPPLLILDEPCQGLDEERKELFLHLINESCVGGNKTLVFVSHYEQDRPPCVTRTLRLEQGRVAGIT
jgi:molybdate transport system ATP-binding protein